MPGTEHKPEVGIRVYVALDTEDPDTVPGSLLPTSIIIGGNKGIPCGTDQGNTVPWGFVFPLPQWEGDKERLGSQFHSDLPRLSFEIQGSPVYKQVFKAF